MAENGGEVVIDGGVSATKVHPFFSAPKTAPKDASADVMRPVTPDPSCSPNSERAHMIQEAADIDELAGDPDSKLNGDRPKKKRRKTDTDVPAGCNDQPPKKAVPRAKRRCRDSAASSILDHFGSKDEQATSDTGSLDSRSANGDLIAETPSQPLDQAIVSRNEANLASNLQNGSQEIRPAVKTHKLLRFNPKTGTIGSPPKVQDDNGGKAHSEVKPAVKAKRGRKPKQPPSRIVTIRYGTDEQSRTRICEAIESIYSGVRFVPAYNSPTIEPNIKTQPTAEKPQTPKKSASTRTTTKNTGAPTHPFFVAKSKQPNSNKSSTPGDKQKDSNAKSTEKRHSIFTSTPCSPKQAKAAPFSKSNAPQFGSRPGGLKIPGAQHPAWPSKGMAHVHGDERDAGDSPNPSNHGVHVAIPHKKAKGAMVRLEPGESVLANITMNLGLDSLTETLQALKTDDFQPPDPALRIPERHLESGLKLQSRVRPELRTWQAGSGKKPHPAISDAYNSLATSLSAFDQSKCETVAWAQKYAPHAAAHVLQSGHDAVMLRDWLQTLKIQSVNTGAADINKTKPKQSAPAKKRKKGKKMDGFIVDDDAEEDELAEISGDEADWAPQGSQGNAKKTVVKAGKGSKESARLTNAVVISGPHGCGKTAAVYAIAKELDFEIFEISPGSRRSGKDILERIGDMTQNHLVQHKQGEADLADIEAPSDDEVARDLKTGKQGTMMTFFKPKTSVQPAKPQTKPQTKPATVDQKVDQALKPLKEKLAKPLTGKGQKQSLILLEEVDILYEEDKQFWATVISLMIQSKRPFVMTCNDESLVPLQNLNLYGIFRFGNPPKDLAVDLLLLIAANEGHALRRRAVETLFDSRHHDLRASITELSYWCQIGIGDLRGGFGWFLHKGVEDVTAESEGQMRVVSTNTYEPGMGWLGRDPLLEACAYRTIEEEAQQQLWDGWCLDYGDLVFPPNREINGQEASGAKRLAESEAVDAFADLLSVADICSSGTYSGGNGVTIDHSVPDLPLKTRDDFIVGRRLLEVETSTRYDLTSMHIALALRGLGREIFASGKGKLPCITDSCPFTEDTAVKKLSESFSSPPYSTPSTTRYDYSLAFDVIAESPTHSGGYLDPSVFDRTMRLITLDVAPFVRSIVAYDQRLQKERLQRSNLLSEGGKPRKRMRTTRAAMSALEGGTRASTRREKYFAAGINPVLVMRTGGEDWASVAAAAVGESEGQQQHQSDRSSRGSSEDCDGDTDMEDAATSG
ncbi:ELG1-like protein [Apiospora rasikravindrae]|uniref:ELG1-like protein n=1 Tax=Apiospora rasikravindrae TaxID=990691 RepID=A0ABR1RX70_9PEZI